MLGFWNTWASSLKDEGRINLFLVKYFGVGPLSKREYKHLYCHVMEWLQTGFELVIGFIEHTLSSVHSQVFIAVAW
jgi:hypothetical protein